MVGFLEDTVLVAAIYKGGGQGDQQVPGARRAGIGRTGNEQWHVLADLEDDEFCLLGPASSRFDARPRPRGHAAACGAPAAAA